MPERLEGYITVYEAAETMGRSTEQVRRYLREGKLEGRRIGGQWFIRETAVQYRTREREGQNMAEMSFDHLRGSDTMAANKRLTVSDRINRRRETIRDRWEKLGASVDVVDLIRQIREEEP